MTRSESESIPQYGTQIANNRQRILLSWSSGKDSAWTLHLLRQDPKVEVVGLLTTINRKFQRVAMHGVRSEILRAQAQAADLPLIEVPLPWPCSNSEYETAMASALEQTRLDLAVSTIAFGDLFLQDVRDYRIKQLTNTGFGAVFPIWGLATDQLAQEMIESGLRARLTCLNPANLPAEMAGAEFNQAFLSSLPETVDPCGERGEFHTCVYAGPMFKQPLNLSPGERVQRDGFVFADFELR